MALFYCKKCGRIIYLIFEDEKKICDCCNSKVYLVPENFLESEYSVKKELKQQFLEEYVKTSPEFDQYFFEHREEMLAQKSSDYGANYVAKMEVGRALLEGRQVSREEILAGKLDESRSHPIVACPYCHSIHTTKISAISKAFDTGLLGIFGTRRYKQWHCKDCGSDF